MATIITSDDHVLSVKVKLNTEIALYSKVKISDAERVAVLAGAGDLNVLGTISSLPKVYPGWAGCDTPWKKLMSVDVDAEVTPGTLAKIGTPDGEGNQRFTTWDNATDSPVLIVGYFLEGGTTTAKMLTV
ncbi:MAG: hypothetical protein PVH61_13885 [Candidatus Aminicenantes bacterium]|jgi:hypothetical protein